MHNNPSNIYETIILMTIQNCGMVQLFFNLLATAFHSSLKYYYYRIDYKEAIYDLKMKSFFFGIIVTKCFSFQFTISLI